MSTYTQIEDIVEQLTVDLTARQFARIDSVQNELVRYEKLHNAAHFQVGLQQVGNSAEAPEYNHIYLSVAFNMPDNFPTQFGECIMFPKRDEAHRFFSNYKISSHNILEDVASDSGRINLIYRVGFEKAITESNEMKIVLRETIDYFCNYITVNMQMLQRTKLP